MSMVQKFYRIANGVFSSGITSFIWHTAGCIGALPDYIRINTGRMLGRIILRCDSRHRRIAFKNLLSAYGDAMSDAEILSLCRKVFENLGLVFMEVCWSLTKDQPALFRHFRIEGRHHMREAHKKGKGVLVLTAHFGNWELLTVIGALLGYPFRIVYRPMDFSPLENVVIRLRTRFGGDMIPKKKGFRKILNSLGRNELVGLLMDQNVACREGVFIPFFNMPACTNKGLALLALKTGAPVIPLFLRRNENGYTAEIWPEIPLTRTGDKIKDIEINTEAYTRAIEEIVRQYPDQWFGWLHRRWNTRPFCELPLQKPSDH